MKYARPTYVRNARLHLFSDDKAAAMNICDNIIPY